MTIGINQYGIYPYRDHDKWQKFIRKVFPNRHFTDNNQLYEISNTIKKCMDDTKIDYLHLGGSYVSNIQKDHWPIRFDFVIVGNPDYTMLNMVFLDTTYNFDNCIWFFEK